LQSVAGFGQVVAPQISRDSDVVQAWRGILLTHGIKRTQWGFLNE
jgi:hypothetical protein